jgi:hypothetical protein
MKLVKAIIGITLIFSVAACTNDGNSNGTTDARVNSTNQSGTTGVTINANSKSECEEQGATWSGGKCQI